MENGHIKLLLPGGFALEMGIVQEAKDGRLVKTDNYCWIIASQDDRVVSMDSFNLGLRYLDDDDKMIFEDESLGFNGQSLKTLSVV